MSYNGNHAIAEIWEDNREDAGSVYFYHYEIVIQNYGSLEQSLIDYTRKVLDVLGVRYGPRHVELMVNNGIPTLIEIGARPSGGIQHQIMEDTQGYSHVSASIDCYLLQGLEAEYLNREKALHVASVSLISRQSGILNGYTKIAEIENLASYKCLVGLPKIGAYVPVSRSLDQQPGILMLAHYSIKQVLEDVSTFR